MIKIIFSILFLGTAIVVFLGPVKKNWEDITQKSVEKRDFNTALENSRKLMEDRDNLIKIYNDIPDSDLIRLDKLIPSNVEKMELVVEIENLIKKHGFSLKDIQVDISSADSKNSRALLAKESVFDAIYLDLSFMGSYRPFLSFVSDLENDLRIMDIESLSFSSGEDDQYEYSMRIKTYSKK